MLLTRRKSKIQIFVMCAIALTLLPMVLFQLLFRSKVEPSGNSMEMREFESSGNESSRGNPFSKKSMDYKRFHGEKLVHLDLKGAPPLVSYLKEFFSLIKELGATGLLIEYEDTFPYAEELEAIKSGNGYSRSEIDEILELAEKNDLTVIPLIQTFGHLEFVLKLEDFKSYREMVEYPEVLCPSHDNSTRLFRAMIDQVLKAHPRTRYVHIGCDEVYYLGKCDKCMAALAENNWTRDDLFLSQVRKIGLHIRETHGGIRPIMWGNKMTEIDEKLIRKHEIPYFVDVMIWNYSPEVSERFNLNFLNAYAKLFGSVWIAGAFKGATGPNRIVTDARFHLKNLMSWMRIVSEWNGRINFKGVTLTGWQRYDHFGVLCELLPVAIPSLAIGLQYLKNFEPAGINRTSITNLLRCNKGIAFSPSELQSPMTAKCNFPGFPAHKSISDFFSLSEKIKNSFPVSSNGWISAYNLIYRFSSPSRVENFFEKFPVERFERRLKRAEKELTKSLSEIYDQYTIAEWILTNVLPVRLRLKGLSTAKEILRNRTVWPRRPLTVGEEHLRSRARESAFDCAFLYV